MEKLVRALVERFVEELICDNPDLEDPLSQVDVDCTIDKVLDDMIDIIDNYNDLD